MFIQTRVKNENEMTVIKLRGVIVDLILNIDQEFKRTFVTTDKKSEKLIFVQCMNAIYVTMVAILLYCKKFVKTLQNTCPVPLISGKLSTLS